MSLLASVSLTLRLWLSAFGLAGLILYGGSADGNSAERCTQVRDYMSSTFLPAIEAIVRQRNGNAFDR